MYQLKFDDKDKIDECHFILHTKKERNDLAVKRFEAIARQKLQYENFQRIIVTVTSI